MYFSKLNLWSWWQESNLQQSAYKAIALPIDLHQHMAPPAGLEPATRWLTASRSTNWAIGEYIGNLYGIRTHSFNLERVAS